MILETFFSIWWDRGFKVVHRHSCCRLWWWEGDWCPGGSLESWVIFHRTTLLYWFISSDCSIWVRFGRVELSLNVFPECIWVPFLRIVWHFQHLSFWNRLQLVLWGSRLRATVLWVLFFNFLELSVFWLGFWVIWCIHRVCLFFFFLYIFCRLA